MTLLVASMLHLTKEDSDIQYILGDGIARAFQSKTPTLIEPTFACASPLASPTSTTSGYTSVTMEDEPHEEAKHLYRCFWCAAVDPLRSRFTLRLATVITHMKTCTNRTDNQLVVDVADFTVPRDYASILHTEECTEGLTVSRSRSGNSLIVQVYQCLSCAASFTNLVSLERHLNTHSSVAGGQKITVPAQFWDSSGSPTSDPYFQLQEFTPSEINSLPNHSRVGWIHTQEMLNRVAVISSQKTRVLPSRGHDVSELMQLSPFPRQLSPRPQSQLSPRPQNQLSPRPQNQLSPRPQSQLSPRPQSQLSPRPESQLSPGPPSRQHEQAGSTQFSPRQHEQAGSTQFSPDQLPLLNQLISPTSPQPQSPQHEQADSVRLAATNRYPLRNKETASSQTPRPQSAIPHRGRGRPPTSRTPAQAADMAADMLHLSALVQGQRQRSLQRPPTARPASRQSQSTAPPLQRRAPNPQPQRQSRTSTPRRLGASWIPEMPSSFLNVHLNLGERAHPTNPCGLTDREWAECDDVCKSYVKVMEGVSMEAIMKLANLSLVPRATALTTPQATASTTPRATPSTTPQATRSTPSTTTQATASTTTQATTLKRELPWNAEDKSVSKRMALHT